MNVTNLQLGYKFKDISLLEMAFTHISYANEHGVNSYEQLEYLGDSVLQLIVSEYLYFNFPNHTSGQLSKYRSHLVSTKNLSAITKKLHFDKYIKIGKALNSVSDALMADLFESVLASIYLDDGIKPAKEFVFEHIIVNKDNVMEVINQDRDYKTELQELLQAMTPQPKPDYILVKTDSKNNKTYFTMQLLINNQIIAEITKPSKRECEKNLSKIAVEKLTNKTLIN